MCDLAHAAARWALVALLGGCGSSPANPWKPGEVDLVHILGQCTAGSYPSYPGSPTNTYSERCTYVGRLENGDSAVGATVQWKVEPAIIPLTTTETNLLGQVTIGFSTPATPGDSVQLWMCASTLPPPCTLIDYGGTVHFR